MPRLACARQAAGGVLALDASPDRASLFPYSTAANARRLIDSLDAIYVFEVAAVDGSAHVRPERRTEDLDLRTGYLVMRIGEGTPY